LKRTLFEKVAAGFLFLGTCLQPISISVAASLDTTVCSPINLKRLINIKTEELGEKRKWEAVEIVLNFDIKKCIEKELLHRYSIEKISENEISFQEHKYFRVSDKFFDAPASDHGWATIYRNKDKNDFSRFLKIAFNVYPNGEINFINLFLIEFDNKIPSFYEINENFSRTSSPECLQCHSKATNNYLFKSNLN